ncbi:hypothetical protein BDR07DRAFT_1371396 [Suillus spraguei]|nr:hypothetical protein BDR07DRAFT_1371396 [Suillus spraguei]
MGCRQSILRIMGYETGKRDRVIALSLEAFIIRLYRERNKAGFLKAFSDQPEHGTTGMSPLKNIMKELPLTRVHIYRYALVAVFLIRLGSRFHGDVKNTLKTRKADVTKLCQHLTEPMKATHHAIVQCMTVTSFELKKSDKTLELEYLNMESAYFSSGCSTP